MHIFQTVSLCQHNHPCCPSLLLTSDVHVPKGHTHHFQFGGYYEERVQALTLTFPFLCAKCLGAVAGIYAKHMIHFSPSKLPRSFAKSWFNFDWHSNHDNQQWISNLVSRIFARTCHCLHCWCMSLITVVQIGMLYVTVSLVPLSTASDAKLQNVDKGWSWHC